MIDLRHILLSQANGSVSLDNALGRTVEMSSSCNSLMAACDMCSIVGKNHDKSIVRVVFSVQLNYLWSILDFRSIAAVLCVLLNCSWSISVDCPSFVCTVELLLEHFS